MRDKQPDLQKIVDDLSKLTVLEAADLAKMLEEKWQKAIPTSGLSDEELKRARADLEVWCPPKEFFEKVGALAKKTTPKEWFNEPRLQFLSDAMILGEFAKQLQGARRVCLAAEAETFPDGFVETPNETLSVETPELGRAGHALRLFDFDGVAPALLFGSKNPSRSTFSTRAL